VGNVLPGWPQPVENAIRAATVAGDINNDGALEILAVDELGVLYVWNANGTEYRDGDGNPSTQGVFYRLPGCTFLYSPPAVADIDSDNVCEIIAGTQAGELYVFNEDGSFMPAYPLNIGNGIAGGPAVGDLDDDGDMEIVINMSNGNFRAYHHDGSTVWTRWYPNTAFFKPSPALGDLTGDGKLEVVIPSSNGKMYAIKSNGQNLGGWPVQYSDYTYTESSPIIADLNGDGSPDVVLGDETKLINAWDANGNLLDGFPLPVADAIRGVPAVADVDVDGDADLVAAGWDQYVYVWDFPGSYDPVNSPWPCFQGNRHNDGAFGSWLPTGITDVAFKYDALASGGVSLTWNLPASNAYGLFDVSRAVVGIDGAPAEFGLVAAGRSVGLDGTLRYEDTGARMGERYVYEVRESNDGGVIHVTGEIYVPVTVGSLSQNYPNPFNPTTQITYYLPEGGARRVRLVVYDVRGARVRTLVDATAMGGKYTVEWDARNDHGQSVGSGVYFYRLAGRHFTQTRKMLLLK
jgi:hypothetical protein